ncbi:ParA family protein [Salipiger marinus]|jgi:chromosome partitioning protein|uniref:Chromosome partitioning protein n=1 Tax=Salipiger marinus TaxID=555512 RepID=A0A1G8I6R1_9RHOB|nr:MULTISPECIES: AAA family ATPase [Salipiger]HBM59809.1 ParA family protein [Citreicella sp.]MCD1617153.1 AAA family ATPase [Salipiger manganoxidans]MEB3417201.1 AAA family ATPase [Salipiger manganoxidans]SDI14512.1 chromosome partitioning protein [Salipiger marinus]HBT01243.1 ParA family protein [Citreicella sp.]
MKIVASYSNKGGVGKTASSVNLAHGLAQSGLRVLLCDLDPQGASGFYFRVKPSKKLTDERFFTDVKRFTDSIRGSDYENLDILPSNLTFRDFDVFLSRMKNSRSRLHKALKSVASDYDIVLLDCPPNLSTLSENVFASADAILVPVIPTTLSERSFEQLLEFFAETKLSKKKILGFFSMVQGTKKLHAETIARMRQDYPKRLLDIAVPFSTDVEKMGVHRAPVATFAASSPAARSYDALRHELQQRL